MEKQKLLRVSQWQRCFAMICMALLLMASSAIAQTLNVKGSVVYASDNTPVIGATVMIKGTQKGTITDANGAFSINGVKVNDIIAVNYIGFLEVDMTVKAGQTTYTAKLSEDKQVIEEVVVVGYGTMRKKEVTGAVARVDSENIVKMSTSDVGAALQGQIAGVNVQASSGQPGAAANIQIRGISSVNGSNSPLYVVDGVPFDGDPGLSPHEIQSIDVLKDAASSAIYGTRGAGGVILVTTKSGQEGAMKVNVDLNYGVQQITSGLSLVNSAEYLYLNTVRLEGTYEAPNRVWSSLWSSAHLFTNNSDLLSIVERNNQPVMNAAITMTGGSKGLTYSLVGNYYNKEGVLLNSGYERFNIRANSTLKKKRWTINANLSAVFDSQESPAWGVYNEVYTSKPTSKQVDPNVSLATGTGDTNELTSMGNILAKFKESNDNSGKGFNVNFSVNYDILDNLAFNTRFGAGYKIQHLTKINPFFEVYDAEGELVINPQTRSGIREDYNNSGNFSWESMLNYNLKKGKHDFKATAVFSIEKYTYESYYAQKYDLISNELPSLGAATGEATVGVGTGQWGQDRTSTLFGMLGRIQYSYDSRYMLSASVRRDGSSRFTAANRWGYFPSVSAGWNVSEEEFWKPLSSAINSFKVRASYGTTGNQNFADYAYSATISTDLDYAFGGSDKDNLELGSSQKYYSNAEVKWETTEQTNLGLDFSFVNSKLTFSADVYQSNKRDMLFPLKIPPVAGTGTNGSVILNVGDMENKGIEFALGWRDSKKDFSYWANATYSRNINEITKMSGTNKKIAIGTISTPNNAADDITFLAEGYEAGAFLMMPTDGIINTDAALEEYQKIRPDAQMGDLRYIDTNEDGMINDSDRVYCGSGAPEAEVGFNFGGSYKGFDVSMSWYSSIGNEVVNGSKVISYQNGVNRDLLYAWSSNNPTSSIPAYRGVVGHYNSRVYADKWVEDGTYLRLRNISVGYSLPKSVIQKIGLTKLRVYVAGDNLLTFTKYDGYDPEVGNNGLSTRGLDNGNYPISSQIRGGIQLNF